ncbi:hypothetical protein [Stutzerimonas zhaodongensis]|uniref:hypothetical protein n=1 Tax=Stutzerimonas TaxID=2901164 RepID=UPI00388D19CD
MRHTTPAPLVRFYIHMRRDHAKRLTKLASALARKKGRDVRLGEALELTVTAGQTWTDRDLLDLAPSDKEAPYWLQLGPINRSGGRAHVPITLRNAQ